MELKKETNKKKKKQTRKQKTRKTRRKQSLGCSQWRQATESQSVVSGIENVIQIYTSRCPCTLASASLCHIYQVCRVCDAIPSILHCCSFHCSACEQIIILLVVWTIARLLFPSSSLCASLCVCAFHPFYLWVLLSTQYESAICSQNSLFSEKKSSSCTYIVVRAHAIWYSNWIFLKMGAGVQRVCVCVLQCITVFQCHWIWCVNLKCWLCKWTLASVSTFALTIINAFPPLQYICTE